MAWKNRGLLAEELLDDPGAKHDLERYLALASQDPEAPAVRKHLAEIARRPRSASLTEAATVSARGLGLAEKGDVAGAIREIDRAIELAPKAAILWNDRGSLRARAGDGAAAIADYTRAIELDPSLAEAWCNRGSELHLVDRAGARRDLDRAIALDETHPRAWYNRGILRAEARDLAGARGDLSRCILLEPGNAEAVWARATVFEDSSELESAQSDHRRYLELAPRGPHADEVKAWLSKHELR